MRLKLSYRGAKSSIYVVILPNGTSPALEFLEGLERHSPASHRSMAQRYKRHADHGMIRNKKISRHITGRGNLYEFKTHQGDRLLYFNRPRGGIVLTNGFHKEDPEQRAFDRAEKIRDDFLAQEDSL